MPQRNLDVVFKVCRIGQPQLHPSNSRVAVTAAVASPPDHSHPVPQTARATSPVEAPPTERTTSAVAATHAAPTSHYQHTDYENVSMKTSDLPPSLKLLGIPAEAVPAMMALFRSRILLHAPDGTPDSYISHHAGRYLAHLGSGEAASTMNELQCETFEWRTDKELALLGTDDGAIQVRAPRNWKEWANACTNLFSPINRIVRLARIVTPSIITDCG